MSKKTEVATTEDQLPDFLKNTGPARGAENVTADDLVIPRLELVQALSPCRKKTDPAYIPGAEEGMLYNNVTRELYGESVEVIPVYFKKEYIVWKDRQSGGGFVGAFPTMEEAEKARMGLDDPDSHTVNDTANHFCLVLDGNGGVDEVVISMSVTKLKISRKWNSLIRMTGRDSFAGKYRLGTAVEQNKQGQDYYNFSIAPAGYPSVELYKRAEALYNAISEGSVSIDRSTDQSTDAPEQSSSEF